MDTFGTCKKTQGFLLLLLFLNDALFFLNTETNEFQKEKAIILTLFHHGKFVSKEKNHLI